MKTALSCGEQFSRITLIILNLIFLLCGIAFLIIGCIFRFGNNELKEDIKGAFEDVEISTYNAYDLFNGLAIVFIVAGAVIIIISAIGFVGACGTIMTALYIYAVIVGLLVVLELAGVILFFIIDDEIEEAFKDGLQTTIDKANDAESKFQEDSQKSAEYMMKTFECCHVNNKRLADLGEAKDTCTQSGEAFHKDCYKAIKDFVKGYSTALIVIGIVVIVVQILMIIFACVVARTQRKEMKL